MEKDCMHQDIKKSDIKTPIRDYTTDYGKGISYYTCDGKVVATIEQVLQYNQMYYENMIIKSQQEETEKTEGFHR